MKRFSDKASKDFFKISNKNLQIAMYNLKTNSFKLYCYLCDNANGYEFDLYSCDFERIANVSPDTYQKAFNTLIEKGYLRPHKSSKTTFMFTEESIYDLPLPDEIDNIVSLNEEDFLTEKEKNFT